MSFLQRPNSLLNFTRFPPDCHTLPTKQRFMHCLFQSSFLCYFPKRLLPISTIPFPLNNIGWMLLKQTPNFKVFQIQHQNTKGNSSYPLQRHFYNLNCISFFLSRISVQCTLIFFEAILDDLIQIMLFDFSQTFLYTTL